jgi:LysR family glycine cleavage system transcriptional activator
VRKGARLASSDLVLRAALQGQGVALARHRLAADDLAAGLLVRPFGPRRVALGPQYWVVRPRTTRERPAVATVIAWLERQTTAAGKL